MWKSDSPRRPWRPVVRKLSRALFVMPAPVVALCPVLIAALMAWVFLFGNQDSPFAYVAYVVSAWSLIVVVVTVVLGRPARAVDAFLHRSHAVGRIVDDKDHRAFVGVCASLGIDVLWAASNFALGAWSASLWFVMLGVYYLMLAVMRGILVANIRRGDDVLTARAMCVCGVLVATLTFVVSGFVVLTAFRRGGFSYPDIIIYAVALYAFFSLGTSIAGIAGNHRHKRQAMFTASNVNLASALVSILALEIAMMSLFGADEDPAFVLLMNALTGAAVAVADMVIGATLVCRAFRLRNKAMLAASVEAATSCRAG